MKKPYSLERRMEIRARKELEKEQHYFNRFLEELYTRLEIQEDTDKKIDIETLLAFHKKYIRALDNYLIYIEK